MADVQAQYVSANGTHVPGLHDPVARSLQFKEMNDQMRQRIMELKKSLQEEQTKSKENHREKLKEIREVKNMAEVVSHSSILCVSVLMTFEMKLFVFPF